MHGQQNHKYTEMHGQQNHKYTEMHGQQNIKTMILLYRYFLSYDGVQFRNRKQTYQGNKFPEISGLQTVSRGNTGTGLPNYMLG